MRLLFVPWGRGMGHVIRCLAIAKEAMQQNSHITAYIATESRWASLVEQFGCQREEYPLELTSLHPWQEWDKVYHLRRSLIADLWLLNQVQPDIVLHDQRFTMPIACEMAGIPCAILAQCHQSPGFSYYEGREVWAFWEESRSAFNVILQENKLPLIEHDIRELIFRYPVLIPSIPEFDPIPERWRQELVQYTGPLLLDIGDSPDIFGGDQRLITTNIFTYGVVQTQQDLENLVEVFRGSSFRIVIAGAPAHLATNAPEVTLYHFVNTQALLSHCSIAIIHGGHGSCMALLLSGTPAVVLPGAHQEFERTWNARRLEIMGVARCLPGQIDWERVKNEIIDMMHQPYYQLNAHKWQKHIRKYQGPRAAWNALQSIMSH